MRFNCRMPSWKRQLTSLTFNSLGLSLIFRRPARRPYSQQNDQCPYVKRPNVVAVVGHLAFYSGRIRGWTQSRLWIRPVILRNHGHEGMRSVTTAHSSSGCPGTGKVPKKRRRLVLFGVARRQIKLSSDKFHSRRPANRTRPNGSKRFMSMEMTGFPSADRSMTNNRKDIPLVDGTLNRTSAMKV